MLVCFFEESDAVITGLEVILPINAAIDPALHCLLFEVPFIALPRLLLVCYIIIEIITI